MKAIAPLLSLAVFALIIMLALVAADIVGEVLTTLEGL